MNNAFVLSFILCLYLSDLSTLVYLEQNERLEVTYYFI